ncbi:MAG: hypothetical protein ACP5Q4_07850 [Candidatus Caldatribacteriaceae bacterium]
MEKRRILVTFLLLVLVAFLTSSCFNLEKVKHFRYEVTVETEKETKRGFFDISLLTEGAKNQVKIDFALGEDQLSTTVDVEESDITSALFPLIMGNPTLAAVITPLGTVQGLVMAMSMGGPLKVGFESKQEDDKGRMMEVRVPSGETRFGKEALWVESYVDGKLAFRALMEKDTYLPFVVDFQDQETLEEGQTRGYFELREIEWKE